MKKNKILLVLAWIISCMGFLLFQVFEKSVCLLFLTIGLCIITFLEYKKFKENDELGFLNRKLLFVYAIGALFSLYVFVFEIK